jgi:XTP/dITP diphosphohydrolase
MIERVRIATGNPGKLREFRELLVPLGIEVLGIDDLGPIEIIEDADTFVGNAIKKANTILELTGEVVIADDSGIVVDALDGAPGVYSARYAGETKENQDAANNQKLLKAMADVPQDKRQARFVCALALCQPGQEPLTFTGKFEGTVGYEERGENGFGYDSLFVVAGDTRTSAELGRDEKNGMSHRGKALQDLLAHLKG